MRRLLTAALLGGTAMMATPVLAQATPEDGSDEIIVTARRRSENLETVPAAVVAFGAETLAERQIRTDSDLQTVAPGLTIRQTQGNNSLTYSIRGQTADTFSGTPSAVIAYLNEVPISPGSASSFYDLESIQVLKGPQGTLFGRNATGGAVLYTSAKPTDRLEGKVTGRIGNLGQREGEAMVNLPMADGKVLLRLAGSIVRRDGYIQNITPGFEGMLGRIEHNSGRASLTLKPGDNLTNTTVFQYSGVDGTNTGASYVWSIYSAAGGYDCAKVNCSSGFLAPYVAQQRTLGLYKTQHPGGARHHGYDWSLSNTTTLDLSDDLTIKNIFGASHARTNSVQPQLGAPFVTIATYNAQTGQTGNGLEVKNVNEELQLQGKGLGDRLEYILGAYFQWQTTDTQWPQTYFLPPPYPAPTFGNGTTCPAGPFLCVTNAFRLKDDTRAIYGQATYALTDKLGVTAGVRYTWDRLQFSQIDVPGNFFYNTAVQKHNYSDPSWEVGLEYKASPELFAYIKTRGSFRAGGFNGARAPVSGYAITGGNEFPSEHTQDIEAGIKYHQPGVTVNVDAFNQWVQDVQRVEFVGGGAITVNVPSQIVQGIEGEASFRLSDMFEIGGQAAYISSRYTNPNIVAFNSTTNSFQNLTYTTVADLPEFSGTLWAQVNLPVAEAMGKVALRADLYGQTSQWFSSEGYSLLPDTKLPGYALVNARLSWDNIMKSGFSGALFARNLTNKGYFVGGMPLGNALGHNAAAVGAPRTWGAELSFRF